jgi:hypothetical protein
MIVLHAVVPRDVGDVADLHLRGHTAGAVTVLYEEADDPPASSRDAVLEHGRRVVALADRTPLLPIRYGTTLPDVDELRAVAAERAGDWSRRLDELAGKCELVVHVEPLDHPARAVESGRAYLEQRIGQITRQERAVDDVRQVLGPFATEDRLLPDRRRLAVLVDRDDADAVRDSVTAWARGESDLDVTVTGPWPPFSFSEDAELP